MSKRKRAPKRSLANKMVRDRLKKRPVKYPTIALYRAMFFWARAAIVGNAKLVLDPVGANLVDNV